MKKNITINFLSFLIATGFSLCLQAQQQKPSERSVSEEQKKIQEYRATLNRKTRQTQQQSDSAFAPARNVNRQQVSSPGSSTTVHTNADAGTNNTNHNTQTTAGSAQQPDKVKPSERIMKRPPRQYVP